MALWEREQYVFLNLVLRSNSFKYKDVTFCLSLFFHAYYSLSSFYLFFQYT